MPPRKRALQVAEAPQRTMPDLRVSVESSIAAMDWLTPADQALADSARALADQIETAVELHEEHAALVRMAGGDTDLLKRLAKLSAAADVQRVVGWQVPLLMGVLKELTATPAARKAAASAGGNGTAARIAQLRSGLPGKTAKTPGA